jgi:hypothetical protein
MSGRAPSCNNSYSDKQSVGHNSVFLLFLTLSNFDSECMYILPPTRKKVAFAFENL